MRKILISLGMIVFVGGVVAGATGAFFSDTETSTGNTFAAGAIDLGIDNTSYYNGVFNQGTSWDLDFDIDNERLLFNFFDLKPGDYGEDTVSLHVTNNESWLCADVSLDSDDDVSCTEPENDPDAENGLCTDADISPADGMGDNGNQSDGNLADNINFLWWADDGDNVLEENEQTLQSGPIGALSVGATTTVTLADASNNIWTGTANTPVLTDDPSEIMYIGKAWCFGGISAEPDDQDGVGTVKSPAEDNAGAGTNLNDLDLSIGDPIDGGYLCNGTSIGNAAQTDKAMMSVAFRAVQARNNANFQCQQ